MAATMAIETEIILPAVVPAITLPNMAFFPQALLPLHIFEPRYRTMLQEVLKTDRLLVVAGLDTTPTGHGFEPPHRIAGLGIVRACKKRDDGTSDLLVQGVMRVEILGIASEQPYRRVRVRVRPSETGSSEEANAHLRDETHHLLVERQRLDSPAPEGMTSLLQTIDDPDIFTDIAAFHFCRDNAVKQRLLSTLNIHERMRFLARYLRREIDATELRHLLQRGLHDDKISHN